MRVERLYPFPAEELQAVIDRYPKIESFAWVQEEPRNMGARKFVLPRDPSPRAVPDPARRHQPPGAVASRRGLPDGSRGGAGANRSRGAHRTLTELLERYRSLIARDGEAFPITLGEGGTPLIHARRLGAEIGLDQLHLKFEGTNPTGSFKDRGMVLAVNRAVAAGARAVVCASTGNTSASAAAYAAAAGLPCHVILPAGKVARGKLAQALAAGARLTMVDGNFDAALSAVRRLGEEGLAVVVNSINPDRLEGQQTAAWEVVDDLGRAPDALALPVGNAGNITAYWRGFRRYADEGRADEPAANARLPGRGRGADRAR